MEYPNYEKETSGMINNNLKIIIANLEKTDLNWGIVEENCEMDTEDSGKLIRDDKINIIV